MTPSHLIWSTEKSSYNLKNMRNAQLQEYNFSVTVKSYEILYHVYSLRRFKEQLLFYATVVYIGKKECSASKHVGNSRFMSVPEYMLAPQPMPMKMF